MSHVGRGSGNVTDLLHRAGENQGRSIKEAALGARRKEHIIGGPGGADAESAGAAEHLNTAKKIGRDRRERVEVNHEGAASLSVVTAGCACERVGDKHHSSRREDDETGNVTLSAGSACGERDQLEGVVRNTFGRPQKRGFGNSSGTGAGSGIPGGGKSVVG
jgi:hypothetical protein